MTLAHYSAAPFVLDRARVYPTQDQVFKPVGLWLSVEGEAEDQTWPSWCAQNEFGLDGLAYRTEIVLRPQATIWHLATAGALRRFHAEFTTYATPSGRRMANADAEYHLQTINWARVKAQTGGLIIAPYQWTARLDLLWYYGWDCASACLWDLRLIHSTIYHE